MATTRRLYHEDPELRVFDAAVIALRSLEDGTVEVELDRSAFYPAGGGQPHDLGRLGGVPLLDVREDGERVIHVLAGPPPGKALRGEVDWDRRLDHRQQHTGQHILSRAFEETARAATVGFHLGAERCTIDLDRDDVDDAALVRAEALANRIVMDDVPVSVTWHDDPSALPKAVRKDEPVSGPIRLVHVGEFDANPCCGTHCGRSGQVGPIKVLRTERKKGGLRVEFVCGGRALRDYARRHETLRAVALTLTTEEFDVPERVRALQDDAKGALSRLRKAEEELRDLTVDRWIAESSDDPIVRDVGPGREAWIAPVASALAARSGRRALVYAGGANPVRMALAYPSGDPGHAGDDLRVRLAEHGGKGGGANGMGQGQAPAAAMDAIVRALGGR